jgi:putative glycosyl hydrolase
MGNAMFHKPCGRKSFHPFLLVSLLTLVTSHSSTPLAQTSQLESEHLSIKDRFGVGFGLGRTESITDYPYKIIDASWYFDWWYEGLNEGDIDYIPLVGGYSWGDYWPDCQTLKTAVSKKELDYPDGSLWVVGNELGIDDGLTPAAYAKHYHYYYSCLKSINNTFKVSFGAIIPIPIHGRLMSSYFKDAPPQGDGDLILFSLDENKNVTWSGKYTDYVVESHAEYLKLFNEKMPVDCYNLHPYSGGNISKFISMVTEFRETMKSLGEQHKPLILTEFGVLDDSLSQEDVIEFMYGALDFLIYTKNINLGYSKDDYRLVQKWAWYNLDERGLDDGGKNTSLFDFNGSITPLGKAYANYIKSLNNDEKHIDEYIPKKSN